MRRKFNLTLRLVPPYFDHHLNRQQQPTDEMDLFSENGKQNQNQQLTIFYDGNISVSNVTDLQARAIIKLASEEMESKWNTNTNTTPGSATSEPSSPFMLSPSLSPITELQMKRSLQRFLQKRKHRLQATSPYHQ
ncbi:protein TIFY 5A-like [Rutidosis leptorrhynchoides]|uniref:protein TIFY 5A-like n=1 Tax=Rutidosis leptorrhynchoides TaxID=125765 RepID=UPI003A99AB9C